MRRSTLVWMVLACAGALVSANTALAGATARADVSIFSSLGFASGSIGSVHNSSDATQSIGCHAFADSVGGFSGECSATDLSGNTVHCTMVNNPAILDAILALGSDSFLTFGWNRGPDCTFVQFETSSWYEAKR